VIYADYNATTPPDPEARSSLRFSLGRETAEEEIARTVTLVIRASKLVREARP